MHFDTPLAFLLLLLLPFLTEGSNVLTRFLRISKKPSHLRLSSQAELFSLPQSLRARVRGPLLTSLRGLAFILLVVALARPQTIAGMVEAEANGRDIMMVLDTSGSMKAIDFMLDGKQTTRLDALKHIVADFVDARRGDRLGLIVFGDEVFTQCPLTLDHRVLKEFVVGLETGMAGSGTALGDAIAIGLKRIKGIESDSKVLVLVTDGMRTAGQLDPKAAAQIAKTLNVRIHTIGIGGTKAAPFRSKNIFGVETVQYREVPLDEETLKHIASVTGGEYFRAQDSVQLKQVYKAIDTLEPRAEIEESFVEYEERFLPFLLLGALLLFLGEILSLSVFAVLP